MTRTPRHLAAAGAAVALLFGAGCSSASDKASEKLIERALESEGVSNVDIDGDAGTFSVDTEDGSFSMGASGSLPDGWPEDVPVADGAEILTGSSMSMPEGDFKSVTFEVGGDATAVAEEYKSAMSGWDTVLENTNSTSDGASSMLVFELDQRTVSVNITSGSPNQVTISHTVSNEAG